ncbi:STAS domain-containing protein [Streptomyces sp.]|uniref:STAS domain-containing protein n=1 Tax=Streptomyces sp. TaxID=1931 RepID=UPI002D79BC51|nr:STAS domain-containing protein [Streptomyces sp.]HET6358138.1 STAS domain-containing protein [Streptomyces sp.]
MPAPGRRAVVHLRGEINVRTAERTAWLLVEALRTEPAVLEVDMAQVTHLSAAGTMAFFAAVKNARASGARLIVTHARPHVRRVLYRLGLVRVLTVPGEDDSDPPTSQ